MKINAREDEDEQTYAFFMIWKNPCTASSCARGCNNTTNTVLRQNWDVQIALVHFYCWYRWT